MKRIGIVDFMCGASRKADAEDRLHLCTVAMGYCWWFWLPRLHWNKGKFWRGQVTDITANWLRFYFNCTIWGNQKS